MFPDLSVNSDPMPHAVQPGLKLLLTDDAILKQEHQQPAEDRAEAPRRDHGTGGQGQASCLAPAMIPVSVGPGKQLLVLPIHCSPLL